MHSLSSTLAFLLLLLASRAQAFSIPIERSVHPTLMVKRDDGKCNLAGVRSNVERAQAKFKGNAMTLERNLFGRVPKQSRRRRHTSRSTIAARPLLSHGGSYWTGPISFGTPPKTFQIDFDTGSTDTILCGNAACTNNGDRRQYQPSRSSTSEKTGLTFENMYGDGSASVGVVINDVVHVGNLKAQNQPLNIASSMAGALSAISADGIMGFSFPALSANGNVSSVASTLYEQGQDKTNTFGFRLSTTPGESELFWGGYNKKKVSGKVWWYTMATDPEQEGVYTYLQLANSVVSVNGDNISGTASTYIVDTGTTLILAPMAAATAFWAAVPDSQPMTGTYQGYWSYLCDTPPTVALSFSGSVKKHYVAAEDFNFGALGSGTRCLGAVVGTDAGVGTSWIIGDAFLKNQYTIFSISNKQIGFATPA